MSERSLRVLAAVATFVVLVALIGVGTLLTQLGHLPVRASARSEGASVRPMRTQASAELVSLRGQVAVLRGALDTIHMDEARLRAAAGLPATDSTTLFRRFLTRLPSWMRTRGRTLGTSDVNSFDSLAGADSLGIRRFAQRANASADSLTDFAGDIATGLRTLTDQADRARRSASVHTMLLEKGAWDLVVVEERTATGIAWRALRETQLLAAQSGQVQRVTQEGDQWWEVEVVDSLGSTVRIRARGRALVDSGERVIRTQPIFVVDSLGAAERVRIDWMAPSSTIP